MKTKMSILSIATALLLSTAACSNSASIDDTPRPADQGSSPEPTGRVATIYTTTGNGSQLLDMSKAEVFTGNNMAPSTIIVDPAQQFQTMDGFGFAITYSTCYNLLKMQPEERTAFL
ncbi:MAG: glucosylceramidase, partial [Prevotella sp.]|nr:glucosylceramidase [Prevotella sp.]